MNYISVKLKHFGKLSNVVNISLYNGKIYAIYDCTKSKGVDRGIVCFTSNSYSYNVVLILRYHT